jgi:hypothetical protein
MHAEMRYDDGAEEDYSNNYVVLFAMNALLTETHDTHLFHFFARPDARLSSSFGDRRYDE